MQKIVVITGATGTLGSRLMAYHAAQGDIIFALSRCDHKISMWQKTFPRVNWCLGDIRNDLNGVIPPIANIVYHCAALKHVDKGEMYPNQYHAVNYEGTLNVFHHIKTDKFVYFSTDKAVLPINFYGMSKGIAEKHLLSIKKASNKNIYIFRWGNIIGSQGSAIHGFVDSIMNDRPVSITNPNMTRFWLKIEDAIKFVTDTVDNEIRNSVINDVLIHPHIKSAHVLDLIACISNILGREYKYEITGVRPGEKIHEHLKSDHDSCLSSDQAEKYTMEELRELIEPTVIKIVSEYKI
jgi:FlaA1/EpsC-like NDP-sugar epimerase